MVTAIVVSGGRGKRFSSRQKKQYSIINDKPIIIHSLHPFQHASIIDDIVLVVPGDDIDYVSDLINKHGVKKVRKVVAGGEQRQDSVYEGIKHLNVSCEYVFIHDAVRPFIKMKDIAEGLDAAKKKGAVVFAIPARNTIKRADEDGKIIATLKRDELYEIQTPQIFKWEILIDAYKDAFNNGYYSTDDAALVERMGQTVEIFPGSPENIKITYEADLKTAKAIMEGWKY